MIDSRQILGFLRCCAVCRAHRGGVEWLCEPCLGHLFDRPMIHQRQLVGCGAHFYLLAWSPEDRFMDSVVYSLKGGRNPYGFSLLTQIMLAHLGPPRAPIYYPSRGVPDHASALAQGLARGGRSDTKATALIKESRSKQAFLGKRERQRNGFLHTGGPVKNVVFVDDILTTGATARSGFAALGRPQGFEVWSLFYRKSL